MIVTHIVLEKLFLSGQMIDEKSCSHFILYTFLLWISTYKNIILNFKLLEGRKKLKKVSFQVKLISHKFHFE